MRDLLQIGQMAVEQSRADGQEVRVAGIVHLDDTPGVLPGTNLAAADLDNVLRSDDGEGHEASQLGVLLHRVFVVLLDVVGEVVDGDPVVLDVLHDKLLGLGQLGGGERVGAADDGDDVNPRSQSLHELDVQFPEAGEHVRARESPRLGDDVGTMTYPWPVGVMKYSSAWTRLSLKRGLRLMRDSSARMSSY